MRDRREVTHYELSITHNGSHAGNVNEAAYGGLDHHENKIVNDNGIPNRDLFRADDLGKGEHQKVFAYTFKFKQGVHLQ
jgi:hypothetical protein